MLTMYKQITIQTLHKQGVQKIQISREVGCHRNTVANVLQRNKLIEKQTRVKRSVFQPHNTQIKELLDKKVSRLRIFEILQEEHGIKSTYVNLCKYIQVHFPKQQEAFGVQVTEPGEIAEIDFGYLGMFQGPLGKLVKTYGLVVVLPYSKLGFYVITYDQKLETLVKELENAFVYFGGVPRKLKVDNMKTAILKNQHYDLVFNQDFLEFAYHYNTVVIPCTPYSPEQKGTVESGIKYLQGNFLHGRVFTDSTDMKGKLKDWMGNYANKRIHGTTRKVPYEEFLGSEREALQPLPEEEFAFFNRGVRIVGANCHVHIANNYYSVPSILVGKEVTVRFNACIIRIIFEGEEVVIHHKARGIGNYVTVRHHLPGYKVYSQTEYQKRFEEKMAEIGEEAHEYFHLLLTTNESYWSRTVRGILGLAQTYGKTAVNLSLKRALYYKATNLLTIKNILEKRLYSLSTEPRLLTKAITQTQGNLFRDLSYYMNERSTQ